MERQDVFGRDEKVRLHGGALEEGAEDERDVVIVGPELPRRRRLLAKVEERRQYVSGDREYVEELVACLGPNREIDPEEVPARAVLRDPRTIEADDHLAHARRG